MAVRNLRTKPVYVWVPPAISGNWKITVERQDGTIDDITDLVSQFEIRYGVTDIVGTFSFWLWNPNETYTGVWTGTETVSFYSDYATTASTLRFRGIIEKPASYLNKLRVTGRTSGARLLNTLVTKEYDNVNVSTIIIDLFDSYGKGFFTTAGVETINTNLTLSFNKKPFGECIQDILKKVSADIYIDPTQDVQFFAKLSRTNSGEAIVHEYNLVDVGEFAEDLQSIRNKVTVNGATLKGVPVFYTAENDDTTYGTNGPLGVRELNIIDASLKTREQCKARAEAELEVNQNPPQIGEVTGFFLATIQPGEQIRISSPTDNIPPATYPILNYVHRLDTEGGRFETKVTVNKEPESIARIFQVLGQEVNQQKDTSLNPAEMKYSYPFTFDTSVGTTNNTEIVDGVLKLVDGVSSGTWVSPTLSETFDITKTYLIIQGETLTGALVEVSADGGNNFTSLTNFSLSNITSPGKLYLLRITLSNTDTQITAVAGLYS